MVVRNRRNWKWTAAMALGLAWGGAQPAWAQGADQPPVTGAPTLPETNVVAEPETPQQPQNVPNFDQPRSILDGTIFDNQTVQGYAADSSTVGSIINLPTMMYPGLVNTVTRDMIRDQQIISLEDALRDIGGAQRGSATEGQNSILRPDTFLLRGMEMTSQNFRKNGFLDPTATPRDFANVERIDVIKGPTSMLYGPAQPTGVLNVTTKQPLSYRMDAGGMQFGSFGLQRYTVDSTGQVMGNENILYRINGAYQDTNSFREFGFNERYLVSPVVTWILTDDTSLTFETEFHQDRRQYDGGMPAINLDPRALPASRFLGDPTGFQVFHDNRAMLTLRSQLTDNWDLYVGGSTLFYDSSIQGAYPLNTFLGLGGGIYTNNPAIPFNLDTLARGYTTGVQTGQNHAVIANLTGGFSLGWFDHVALIGTENNWYTQTAFYQESRFDAGLGIGAYTGGFNFVFDPTLPGPFPVTDTNTPLVLNSPYVQQNRNSVYAQDLVEIAPQLKLLYGGRWDHLQVDTAGSYGTATIPFVPFQTSSNSFDQGTYRAGLIYDVIPEDLMLYATRMTSFNPPGDRATLGVSVSPTGAVVPVQPELGGLWEAGFKARLVDNMFLTVSGFHITRSNVVVGLPGGSFNFVQAGQQRSQGVDVNLVGQFTERWSMIGNYTYTDVLQDDYTGVVDGRVRNVPFNMGNVWSRYDMLQTRESTIGVALGVTAVGQRLAQYANAVPPTGPAFYLAAYDRWDMGFYGRRGRWNGGVYWENIFNTRYETGSISQFQIFPGAPMNARVQLGAQF